MKVINIFCKGYEDGKGRVMVKLQQALYGCIESAALW